MLRLTREAAGQYRAQNDLSVRADTPARRLTIEATYDLQVIRHAGPEDYPGPGSPRPAHAPHRPPTGNGTWPARLRAPGDIVDRKGPPGVPNDPPSSSAVPGRARRCPADPAALSITKPERGGRASAGQCAVTRPFRAAVETVLPLQQAAVDSVRPPGSGRVRRGERVPGRRPARAGRPRRARLPAIAERPVLAAAAADSGTARSSSSAAPRSPAGSSRSPPPMCRTTGNRTCSSRRRPARCSAVTCSPSSATGRRSPGTTSWTPRSPPKRCSTRPRSAPRCPRPTAG